MTITLRVLAAVLGLAAAEMGVAGTPTVTSGRRRDKPSMDLTSSASFQPAHPGYALRHRWPVSARNSYAFTVADKGAAIFMATEAKRRWRAT